MKSSNHSVRLLFLGQCLHYGYQGIDKTATFTSLAMSMLESRFPMLNFRHDVKYLHHPTGLKALLRHELKPPAADADPRPQRQLYPDCLQGQHAGL